MFILLSSYYQTASFSYRETPLTGKINEFWAVCKCSKVMHEVLSLAKKNHHKTNVTLNDFLRFATIRCCYKIQCNVTCHCERFSADLEERQHVAYF